MPRGVKRVPSNGESEPEGAVPDAPQGADGPGADEETAAAANKAELKAQAAGFKDEAKAAIAARG